MSGLPDRISRCWRGGFHSRGAGPCFDTIEQAIAFRDQETREIAEWCDARADSFAVYDFEQRRSLTWREQWDIQGWPDGRERETAL